MSSTANEVKLMEDRAIYNMHDAKSNLSRLVEQAAAGREIIIARDGKPAARLVALDGGRRPVRLGLATGRFAVPDDFDDPLPDELWGDLLNSSAP
jgi:prevent-host-death family protein